MATRYLILHNCIEVIFKTTNCFQWVNSSYCVQAGEAGSSGQEGENRDENAAALEEGAIPIEEECESMGSTNSGEAGQSLLPKPEDTTGCHPVMVPAYFSPFFPLPFPMWPGGYVGEGHEIVRPTAIHSKAPINVEELVGISKLTLAEQTPSLLSLKLANDPSRQSAFHANSSATTAATTTTEANPPSSNPIHAL